MADISIYLNMAEEIMLENPTETVKFLSLDCNPLKEVFPHACWYSALANCQET